MIKVFTFYILLLITTFAYSNSSQDIVFTIVASDASGIDWGRSKVTTKIGSDTGSAVCEEVSAERGVCTYTVSTPQHPEGDTQILSYEIFDKSNVSGLSNSILIYPETSDIDVPSQITVLGGRENIPPQVSSITADRITVNVSSSSQDIVFTIVASDASGVDWGRSKVTTKIGSDTASAVCEEVSAERGVCTYTVSTPQHPEGDTQILSYEIFDKSNISGLSNSILIYPETSDIDVPSQITVLGGRENIPPQVSSITADRITVDISTMNHGLSLTLIKAFLDKQKAEQ